MPGVFSQDAEGIDVRYVANLARLALEESEIGPFQAQIDQVLEHVRKLNELDVADVEPTAHAAAVENVFRADEARACLPREKAMANAPLQRNNQFIVPKIIE